MKWKGLASRFGPDSTVEKAAMESALVATPWLPPRLLVRLALSLRRALLALANGLVPPQLPLFELATGAARTQLLGAAARLRIADLVAKQPKDAGELARQLGCNPDALHRMMRALASTGCFELLSDGRFANNAVSEGLRSDVPGSSRDFAIYFASRSNVGAWADFGRTLETGDNAFSRVHGKSVWSWFDEHPEERTTFAAAMGSMTQLDAGGIARAYPFEELGSVCDVAGGRGMLLSEVLRTHPHLRGVLVDNPGVLASATGLLEARGVAGRVELRPGSFFDELPSGCDAYLLKNVLHDWSDETSERILQCCRRAMRPGQRLLLVELLVERNSTYAVGPMSDVQMMVVCDEGRERSVADFERLLARTGFALRRVLPTRSLMSIVEAVAA